MRSSSRSRSWRIGWCLTAATALVTGLVVVKLAGRDPSAVRVTASSSAAGQPAAQLASATDDPARPVRWRSDGQAAGASITVTWSSTTSIGRLEARAPADPTLGIRDAYLTVSDGSSLVARPDRRGDIVFSFTERSATWATLTVTAAADAASAVGLSSLRISADGALAAADGAPLPGVVATASSSGDGTTPAALVDSPGDGTGSPWRSTSGQQQWAEVGWAEPREISSIQIFGSPDDRGTVSSGRLEFSDGSVVSTAGVAAGNARPTTIAFMPRVATSVRFVVTKADGAVALREIEVFERGQTPPASSVTSGLAVLSAGRSAGCAVPAAPNRDRSHLRLLCPEPGTEVEGVARVVVAAPPASTVTATAWIPFERPDRGSEAVVAQAVTSAAGYAEFDLASAALPRGPATVRMDVAGDPSPLHVQLYNPGGLPVDNSVPEQSSGMTLAWAEEFRSPLSVSRTGADAVYAATKPSFWGPSEFGGAVFADPSWNTDNVGIIDGEYLRLRVNGLPPGRADPLGYDRTYLGGMVSSVAVGGAGFSAQYGYFEARMLGAPGPGTWPAFWALSTANLVDPDASTGEVDAVELYGHDTSGSCHGIHNWIGGADGAQVDCDAGAESADWALRWHTYGARVTPSGTTFYVDGVQVTSMPGPINADQPFFFMVDLAMGGGWPTDLTATGGISDAYVDYVRVYT